MNLSTDDIMDRLARLSRLGTSVMCRPTFPSGPKKWYVSMSGVDVPVHTGDMSGATPQEAIHNTWKNVANSDRRLVLRRYFCKSDESIPGNGPQVWVRWNPDNDDWEDVIPRRDDSFALQASEIRPYLEHKWRERL
jgi:hypothetical protein